MKRRLSSLPGRPAPILAGVVIGLGLGLGLMPGPGVARVIAMADDKAGAAEAPHLEIQGTVVDAMTSKPIPKYVVQYGRPDPKDPARILWGWSEGRIESANPEGRLRETLGETGAWKRVLAAGYLPQPITAKPYDGEAGSIEVTVKLRRGRQIAGRVLDHANKAVGGASVFLVGGRGAVNITGGKAVRSFIGGEDTTVTKAATGADGRSTLDGAGADATTVAVSAPTLDLWLVPAPLEGDELEVALPEPGKLFLRYDIDGGEPEATVFLQLLRDGRKGWEAAENLREPRVPNRGRLVLEGLTPGTYDISRMKKGLRVGDAGLSPFCDRRDVVVESGKTAEVAFVRESGAPVEGEVVGLKALKLPGAFVLVDLGDEARDGKPDLFARKHVEALTCDDDGRFKTPRLLPGTYTIVAEAYTPETPERRGSTGFRAADHRAFAVVTVPEDGPAPRVRIEMPGPKAGRRDEAPRREQLAVQGRVIDAATKRPIARFRVIPGAIMSRGVTWQPHLITDHAGGRFDLPPDERAWAETRFRVEAEGYRPGVSRVVKKSEGEATLEFALQADAGLPAVVRTSDGAPAAGARAAWATNSREATGTGAAIAFSGHAERLGARVVTADAEGRLRLPPESDPGVILVAHGRGHAEIAPADLAASPVVTLRDWCRVEGRVLAGTRPVAGQAVWIYRPGDPLGVPPTATWDARAITDAAGRFACDKVIPGRLIIDREFTFGDIVGLVNGLATEIEVREGPPTRVTLGGPGRTLVGRFEAPKDLGPAIDWSKVQVGIGLDAPHIGFPGDEAAWKLYRAFLNSDEGKAYSRDGVPIGRDGSFRIESVPPGDYQLLIWATGPAVGKPAEAGRSYATGGARVEVGLDPDGRGDETRDLGTIVLRRSPHDE